MESADVQTVVRQAIQEFLEEQTSRTEPAYKAELVEESKRSRQAADQAERGSAIRAELQRLGVAKIDLAYRAVQESIFRSEDGRLLAHGDSGEITAKEYLAGFVSENPEFLPARISGGSGITAARKALPERHDGVDMDAIRPGMTAEEMDRVRKEIVRVASQSLRGV